MYRIRPAELSDLNRLHELIEELEGHPIDPINFASVYEENMKNPRIFYYIATKDSVPVGFMSVHVQRLLHHAGNIAEVQELIVTEGCRSTGLGILLLSKAKSVAKEQGCIQMEVSCNMKRTRSHGFYESQDMRRSHYKFTCMINGKGETT